jgi:alkylresorcinol/alkylpyrone synthase
VPPTVLAQDGVRDLFGSQPELGRLGTRLVSAAFGASGIRTRHTVLRELGTAPGMAGADAPVEPDDGEPVFYDRASGRILTPGTGARNDAYIREAPALLLGAARQALDEADGIEAADVTHVVTVSCTGFYAPGPDYAVVRGLGLGAATQRFHLGFMGCYGAFPALRMAAQFCAADPDAVVLVVCVELCSLHLHSSGDADTIVASSVFGDGAAAAVVTARPAPAGSTVLDLDAFETVLTPVGEDDMAWTIGDQGFDMILSSYVPKIIDEHITGALERRFPRSRASLPPRSRTGPSTRAAAASSTAWRTGWTSLPRSSPPRGRRSRRSATCRARRCCSCSGGSCTGRRPPTCPAGPTSRSPRPCRRPGPARDACAPWRSALASRSRRRS